MQIKINNNKVGNIITDGIFYYPYDPLGSIKKLKIEDLNKQIQFLEGSYDSEVEVITKDFLSDKKTSEVQFIQLRTIQILKNNADANEIANKMLLFYRATAEEKLTYIGTLNLQRDFSLNNAQDLVNTIEDGQTLLDLDSDLQDFSGVLYNRYTNLLGNEQDINLEISNKVCNGLTESYKEKNIMFDVEGNNYKVEATNKLICSNGKSVDLNFINNEASPIINNIQFKITKDSTGNIETVDIINKKFLSFTDVKSPDGNDTWSYLFIPYASPNSEQVELFFCCFLKSTKLVKKVDNFEHSIVFNNNKENDDKDYDLYNYNNYTPSFFTVSKSEKALSLTKNTDNYFQNNAIINGGELSWNIHQNNMTTNIHEIYISLDGSNFYPLNNLEFYNKNNELIATSLPRQVNLHAWLNIFNDINSKTENFKVKEKNKLTYLTSINDLKKDNYEFFSINTGNSLTKKEIKLDLTDNSKCLFNYNLLTDKDFYFEKEGLKYYIKENNNKLKDFETMNEGDNILFFYDTKGYKYGIKINKKGNIYILSNPNELVYSDTTGDILFASKNVVTCAVTNVPKNYFNKGYTICFAIKKDLDSTVLAKSKNFNVINEKEGHYQKYGLVEKNKDYIEYVNSINTPYPNNYYFTYDYSDKSAPNIIINKYNLTNLRNMSGKGKDLNSFYSFDNNEDTTLGAELNGGKSFLGYGGYINAKLPTPNTYWKSLEDYTYEENKYVNIDNKCYRVEEDGFVDVLSGIKYGTRTVLENEETIKKILILPTENKQKELSFCYGDTQDLNKPIIGHTITTKLEQFSVDDPEAIIKNYNNKNYIICQNYNILQNKTKIYDNGIKNDSIEIQKRYTDSYSDKAKITENNNSINITVNDNSKEWHCSAYMGTTNKIDLTNYQMIRVTYTKGNFDKNNTCFYLGVNTGQGQYGPKNVLAYKQINTNNSATIELDISKINVEAYIECGISSHSITDKPENFNNNKIGIASCDITKIELFDSHNNIDNTIYLGNINKEAAFLYACQILDIGKEYYITTEQSTGYEILKINNDESINLTTLETSIHITDVNYDKVVQHQGMAEFPALINNKFVKELDFKNNSNEYSQIIIPPATQDYYIAADSFSSNRNEEEDELYNLKKIRSYNIYSSFNNNSFEAKQLTNYNSLNNIYIGDRAFKDSKLKDLHTLYNNTNKLYLGKDVFYNSRLESVNLDKIDNTDNIGKLFINTLNLQKVYKKDCNFENGLLIDKNNKIILVTLKGYQELENNNNKEKILDSTLKLSEIVPDKENITGNTYDSYSFSPISSIINTLVLDNIIEKDTTGTKSTPSPKYYIANNAFDFGIDSKISTVQLLNRELCNYIKFGDKSENITNRFYTTISPINNNGVGCNVYVNMIDGDKVKDINNKPFFENNLNLQKIIIYQNLAFTNEAVEETEGTKELEPIYWSDPTLVSIHTNGTQLHLSNSIVPFRHSNYELTFINNCDNLQLGENLQPLSNIIFFNNSFNIIDIGKNYIINNKVSSTNDEVSSTEIIDYYYSNNYLKYNNEIFYIENPNTDNYLTTLNGNIIKFNNTDINKVIKNPNLLTPISNNSFNNLTKLSIGVKQFEVKITPAEGKNEYDLSNLNLIFNKAPIESLQINGDTLSCNSEGNLPSYPYFNSLKYLYLNINNYNEPSIKPCGLFTKCNKLQKVYIQYNSKIGTPFIEKFFNGETDIQVGHKIGTKKLEIIFKVKDTNEVNALKNELMDETHIILNQNSASMKKLNQVFQSNSAIKIYNSGDNTIELIGFTGEHSEIKLTTNPQFYLMEEFTYTELEAKTDDWFKGDIDDNRKVIS